MASDKRARNLLVELADADIMHAVAVADFGHAWAEIANIRHKDLVAGSPRALRATRTAILRDWRRFTGTLLTYWELEVAGDIGEHDDGDPLARAARVCARKLGAATTKALLASVADSTLDVAKDVAARFDELCQLTESPATSSTDGLMPMADEAALSLDDLIVRTRTLREQGKRLAQSLRAAADAIDGGRPADPVDSTPETWTTAVRAHLASASRFVEADHLMGLEDRLVAMAGDRTRLVKAKEALETAEFLDSRGLSDMVPDALARVGFSSVDELRRLVQASQPLSDADERQTRHASEVPPPIATGVTAPAVPEMLAQADFEIDEAVETDARAAIHTLPIGAGNTPQDLETSEEPADALEPALTDPVSATHPSGATFDDDPTDTPPPGETSQSELHDESASSSMELPEFPWDEGEPPLLARLMLEERYALACHVADATETQRRKRLLRFACAATQCSASALELALPQLLLPENEIDQLSVDELRVLLAAALRVGWRLGYAPLGVSGLVDRAELGDTGYEPVLQALAIAVQRGRTHGNGESALSNADLTSRWTSLGREARELADRLAKRALKYQRASKVLHHLIKSSQPLGKALGDASALTERGVDGASGSEWTSIEKLADDLGDQSKRERLLERADEQVSSRPQLRNPIVSRAREQLHDALQEVADVLSRLVSIRRAILNVENIKDVESAQELGRALEAAPPGSGTSAVGEAALVSLIEWMRTDPVDPVADSLDQVLDRELLGLFEIPRGIDGRPAREPTPQEVAMMLSPRAPRVIVAGHLAKGDVDAARRFIVDRGLEHDGFDDDVQRARQEAARAHKRALADAETGTARLRSMYKDDLARLLSATIEGLRVPRQDRFDLAVEALRDVVDTAEDALQSVQHDLRERTKSLSASDETKARILDRLDQGDEPLAVEYLTTVQAGEPLPAAAVPHGDDFGEFFPRIVRVAEAAAMGGTDPIAAVRDMLSASDEPADRQLRDGLRDWGTLKNHKQAVGRDSFRVAVANVMRMIGLVSKPTDWLREISRTQRSGYAAYQLKASPVDRSYVPQLGTQAHGTYDITLVWDKATPERLMDFVDERRKTQPNVIIYFGVLSVSERLRLRSLTLPGHKGFSPLVIDEAVIAWLSNRQEPGWRFTQRVTLPFTTINPYTPFAGGEVPEEVFVGRSDERSRIVSPTGSMFVYGGRQLGKSALLRRVERLFSESSTEKGQSGTRVGNVAVYIDLKAAGIGESLEPAALWPLLGDRLKAVGVIPERSGKRSSVDDVTAHIKRWLDGEPSNRLLVLLDEADNFLTADAKGGASADRAFPVLQTLKGLMATSERRFKPVFAGLHQVQRFHDSSNTPVAHGGKDIRIGPLRSSDAYRLVVDPTNALGYAFAGPELVWQLLLVTNYQASLVQIVCEALVRHLHERPLPAKGGRVAITGNDIRAVCEDPLVRELIAERFRWTINLDSRYRVIALVVALRSLDADEPGTAFSINDLRDDCETYWEIGFSSEGLSRSEFERYLVEMVGLGVLHRQGDLFGLRSPNIVRMLGSPQSLEEELAEAHRYLEPALEYNPAMTRQVIGESAGFWSPRSPLTDDDIARLLSDNSDAPVHVVFGSEALAVERVADVIRTSADMKDIPCAVTSGPEPEKLNQHHFGRRTHIVIDMSADSADADLATVLSRVAGRRNLTATIIVGPDHLAAARQMELPLLTLQRWSVDGLRSWYESPFESIELRKRLFRVTSGWPKLVEQAMRSVADGSSPDRALDAVVENLTQPSVARTLLLESAIDPSVAEQWVTWFSTTSTEDGLVESVPTSIADLTEAIGRDAVPALDDLEALDLVTNSEQGWLLDRVIAAAATVLNRETQSAT